MHKSAVVSALLGCVLLAGCTQLERLTLIRPSAQPRGFTQIAPTYDVSGKKGRDSTDPMMLLAVATELYQQGQLDEAERIARKALKAKPESGDGQTLLGAIAQARGDMAAAGRAYKAAVDLRPNDGLYANNYGGWLCETGQAAQSLAWFDRALADPGYPTPVGAMVNGGTCAIRAGQPLQAESRWRSALAVDPQNLTALAGMAKLESERGNNLEARAFVERWLALQPDDATGLRLAAEVEQKLGDNAAASRYLSRLQAIPPGSPSIPRTQ
ncbi:MAG: tetratricopeptide repeat protein [Xanthomonadaceae bacterium]|nr:tetratricopeptide repeat protein [Xanthomonadaceae bacterium]